MPVGLPHIGNFLHVFATCCNADQMVQWARHQPSPNCKFQKALCSNNLNHTKFSSRSTSMPLQRILCTSPTKSSCRQKMQQVSTSITNKGNEHLHRAKCSTCGRKPLYDCRLDLSQHLSTSLRCSSILQVTQSAQMDDHLANAYQLYQNWETS